MPVDKEHHVKLHYRGDIDGLRALAILAVVFYHVNLPPFSGGFTGVDVFLVISGYLIGGHVGSDLAAQSFSFLAFYRRRARRILPALYCVLFLTFAVSTMLLSPTELTSVSSSSIAALLSVSNVYFQRHFNYFQQGSELDPLLMTWSLSLEEQFYLLLPLVLLVLSRMRKHVAVSIMFAICLASFLYSWHKVHSAPDSAFYLLPSRAWELGIGVLLSTVESMRRRSFVAIPITNLCGFCGLAAILTSFLLVTPVVAFPGPSALASVLGTALLLATPKCWVNRLLLSHRTLGFIGKISYSWYLLHWPLLALLRLVTGGPLPIKARVVAVALSFLLAVVSFYLIEQPFRRVSLTHHLLLSRYALVASILLAMFITFGNQRSRLIHDSSTMSIATEASSQCLVQYGDSRLNRSPDCYPAGNNQLSVALWGDSHSAALAPALRMAVTTRGGRVLEFSKASCLPLADVAKYIPSHPQAFSECISYNSAVRHVLVNDNAIHTVILTGRWADPFIQGGSQSLCGLHDHGGCHQLSGPETARTFVAALFRTIAELHSAGKRVVLLGDVPNFDFDPTHYILNAKYPFRRRLVSWMSDGSYSTGSALPAFPVASERAEVAMDLTAKQFSNVTRIDLRKTFCDQRKQCAYLDAGHLLYSDSQHITQDGALYALRNPALTGLLNTCLPPIDESAKQ
jgi:peptidoglycan/LPS O-acetylase OafA/YrhL